MDATMKWIKSSYCANGQCVEVSETPDFVHVRDGKNPDGDVLSFPHSGWREFIAGIQAGDFSK